jgi:NTE family protein
MVFRRYAEKGKGIIGSYISRKFFNRFPLNPLAAPHNIKHNRDMADSTPSRKNCTAIPLPDDVALVLQGGGALGAFQAGVYESLSALEIEFDRIAGISIGAVNAALIAGNPPEKRIEALKAFWKLVSSSLPSFPIWPNERVREWVHEWSAGYVAMTGVPGFFRPRLISPFLATPGTPAAQSYYDVSALQETLNSLVDWDLLNDGPIRVAVGAVDVESGNFHYFDTAQERLDARHIMASGALPPGFPPVEIDGRWWWDGGLVSNTPLTHIMDTQESDMLIFQIDLFAASNHLPTTMSDVLAREKEVRYSSRTRQVSNQYLRDRKEKMLIAKALSKIPAELHADPDIAALKELSREHAVNVVQLIYRANDWENGARDYEFSQATMQHHWDSGSTAVAQTMQQSQLISENILDGRTAAFDLANNKPKG